MKTYLIKYDEVTSEWLGSLNDVQILAERLQQQGFVNITIQQFINRILNKSYNYSYNGETWEKI